MKNIQNNIKILIAINIFLISISWIGEGGGAFLAVPAMLLINFFSSIYGFVKKDKHFGIVALILFFIGPIIGFSICLSVFKLNIH